ncbi:MAG: hypothetical protein IT242_06065 [Bacteroidia bacterium]|nr:hypothetical protein [Bacteroidia bacterium]
MRNFPGNIPASLWAGQKNVKMTHSGKMYNLSARLKYPGFGTNDRHSVLIFPNLPANPYFLI